MAVCAFCYKTVAAIACGPGMIFNVCVCGMAIHACHFLTMFWVAACTGGELVMFAVIHR